MTLDDYEAMTREEQVRLGAEALALAAAVSGRDVVRMTSNRRVPSRSAGAIAGSALSQKVKPTKGTWASKISHDVHRSAGSASLVRSKPKKAG
jgi:hypothetical protein